MQYDTTEGSKGICPTGWHVPSWNEFATLKSFVGNNGNELKEIGQGTGTNTSGFSALLAGISYNSIFYYMNKYADFWASRIYDNSSAYNIQFVGSTNIIQGSPVDELLGCSIRCINNLTVSELPVELTKFTVSVIGNNVLLNWNTATEVNTSSFDIEMKLQASNTWQIIASVSASGNSNSSKQYSFTDKKITTGKYNYRLKLVDFGGSSKYSNIVSVEIVAPAKFELGQNYPNPWNPTTTIRYQVPVNILVTIKAFDILGKEVATLVNELKPAGNYEVTLNGKNLSSGVYYYQMKAGTFFETKKFVLIK
ncbi:MAG: FISUMP domain-containing protein, partial [Ignavibacteriaceae bacterium]|nr:FISUMP domain-containing protein [Ignavibacteriaceae bacterium]